MLLGKTFDGGYGHHGDRKSTSSHFARSTLVFSFWSGDCHQSAWYSSSVRRLICTRFASRRGSWVHRFMRKEPKLCGARTQVMWWYGWLVETLRVIMWISAQPKQDFFHQQYDSMFQRASLVWKGSGHCLLPKPTFQSLDPPLCCWFVLRKISHETLRYTISHVWCCSWSYASPAGRSMLAHELVDSHVFNARQYSYYHDSDISLKASRSQDISSQSAKQGFKNKNEYQMLKFPTMTIPY